MRSIPAVTREDRPDERFTSPLRIAAVPSRVGSVAPVVVFLVILGVTLVAVFAIRRANDGRVRLAHAKSTEEVVTAIDQRMTAYVELLHSVRALMVEDVPPSRERFADFVEALAVTDRLPGVRSIGAAHVYDRADLDEVAREIDADAAASGLGYPAFAVDPSTDDPIVLAVDYVSPVVGNEQSYGFDIRGEANRRATAEQARDTGGPAATAPLTLVGDREHDVSFGVMLPIYAPGAPLENLDQRREAFVGVVYASFVMPELVGTLLESDRIGGHLEIYDLRPGERPRAARLTFSSEAGHLDAIDADLESARFGLISVAGRPWTVYYDSHVPPLSNPERIGPTLVLVSGAIIAALIAFAVSNVQTSRSRALLLAREMSGEIEALTEAASEAIVTVDAAGRIVAWNRGATEMFGHPAEEVLGVPMTALIPDRLREVYTDVLQRVATDDEVAPMQAVLLVGLRADGEEFPVDLTMSRWNAHGMVFFTGFLRDLTARVEAERRLLETTELLSGVLEGATEMSIIATDTAGRVAVFNKGAELMLGRTSDEVLGAPIVTIHDATELAVRAGELGVEPGFDALVAVARRRGHETREWTYRTADGSRVPVELTVTPMYEPGGTVTGYIAIALDITHRREAAWAQAQALARERDMVGKLRELDRAKSEFMSTISHELRTPLTSVLGFVELLSDEPGRDPEDVEMLAVIERNAQRLLALVEDILTLSRLETGTLTGTDEALDVGQLVTTATDAIAPLAAERDLRLQLHVEPALPGVIGRRSQLERVVANLLGNAVKFSEPGGSISVAARSDAGEVTITVSDTGIGIPAGEIDQLFTRFYRTSNASDHAIQGTGLGLAIAHEIVEHHGGRITVESVEGRGSTFTVHLPAADMDAEARREDIEVRT